jgi:hypothetical protein
MAIPHSKNCYGVISSFIESENNTVSHNELKSILVKNGYQPFEINDSFNGTNGPCWLIKNISMADLVSIAVSFRQRHVIFCPKNGHPRILDVSGVSKTNQL